MNINAEKFMDFEGKGCLQIWSDQVWKNSTNNLCKFYNCSLSYLLERHSVLILDVKVMENLQSPRICTVSGKLPSLLKNILLIFSSE